MTGLPLLSAWRRPDALLLTLSICASILLGLDFSIAPVLPNLDSSYAFAFSHAAILADFNGMTPASSDTSSSFTTSR